VLVAVAIGASAAGIQVTTADGRRPKAVIVVGPSGMDTPNKKDAARIARQARDAGMRVILIQTPRATWKRVAPALEGASFVAYLGHGNGYPGPHGTDEDTHNGLGLNPRLGVHSPVDYQGADRLRKRVRLARNAVVLLYHLCYASGNGEEYMGPEFDRDIAVARTDNFAAGFLDIGARAVFAYGTDQDTDLPGALMRGNRTMDEIFKARTVTAVAQYDGFVGRRDYYHESKRTGWARLHMDPHPTRGHYRALTGDLQMRAAAFRAGAGTVYQPPWRIPDRVAPVVRLLDRGGADIAGDTLVLTPNGDHSGDTLRVRRTLSEKARIEVEVRNRRGRLVRQVTRDASRGRGTIAWDGRDRRGRVVPDGRYRITVTARDKAGNRGKPRTITVLVVTALRGVRRSVGAFHAADRDRLARSVRIAYALTRYARVAIRIEDQDGDVVRSRSSRSQGKGRHDWVWDGRDDAGTFVRAGSYTIVVSATTRVGTVRTTRSVYVGAYRIGVSDATPGRGQGIRIRVDATERQKTVPILVLTQGGGSPRRVRMQRDGKGDYVSTLRLWKRGGSGSLSIRVVGRDQKGHVETQTRMLPLH
jgi:flagellar hook assembly protein FlgD